MKFQVTIEMEVNCMNENSAKNAGEELKKFIGGNIAKSYLLTRGVTLTNPPIITVERKR